VRLLGALLGLAVAVGQGDSTPLLRYLQVGTRRIAFESSGGTVARFRFVDQALGPARRPSSAIDGQAASACYRPIADPFAGPVSLLFESDEMGSPEDLTEFEVIPAGSRPEVEKGCVRLRVAARRIVTDRGLRLGLTRAAVGRLLGKPTQESGDTAEWERTTERTITTSAGASDRYDQFSLLTVTFRRGRVVAFSGALGETD
jgi:hypothetical protein